MTYEESEDFRHEKAQALASRPHQADVAQDPEGEQEAQVEPWFPEFEDAAAANIAAKEQFKQPGVLAWGNSGESGVRSALAAPQQHYYGMFGQLPEGASPDPTERLIEATAKLGYHVGESQGFDDGNKRTARALVESTFENNGLDHIIPEGHDDEEYADHLKGYGVRMCHDCDQPTDPNNGGACTNCGQVPADGGYPRHTLDQSTQLFKERHANGGPDVNYVSPYPDDDENFGGTRQSNILDPIHDTLDPSVWENPAAAEPTLRPEHSAWLHEFIFTALARNGYEGAEQWLTLVFTGSLTTYQYSDDSDTDISLFVDTEAFPDWSRAEMIGVMISECDGVNLPGTTHPIQGFVVSPKLSKEDLYKPGLRSGYDMSTDQWIVPPERDRVHDVEREMNEAYTIALENADKMEKLLRYEPDKAVMFWHQIHKRRQADQGKGKGDYSPSNITYKMLNNRGLFPKIEEASGEHIASQSPSVRA
jgi:hypothetical protein